jgi:hypothetical protein
MGLPWRLLSIWEPNNLDFAGNLDRVRRFGAYPM